MAFSITFTYPLVFVALKSAVLALFNNPNPTDKTNAAVVSALLGTITAAALVLKVID
jgi:hypothetical protein